jgi:hypothetical protein
LKIYIKITPKFVIKILLFLFILFLEYDIYRWTSGCRLGDDPWIWEATEELVSYTDWAPLQPSSNLEYSACISFKGALGGWEDQSTDYGRMGFMCE